MTIMKRRTFLATGAASLVGPALLCPANAFVPHNFDAFAETQRHKAKIPGMAIGFAEQGRARFTRGYGLADIAARRAVTPGTVFHIASVTKTVTATMIVMLLHERKIALDSPVAPYLDFALTNPYHPKAAITFRHLLMHLSSISDERYYAVDFVRHDASALPPLRDFLTAYLVPGGKYYDPKTCYSDIKPGTHWDYSNVGFAVLGYLAGRIAGRDMRQGSQAQIFSPLGMQHTAWNPEAAPKALRAIPYEPAKDGLTPLKPTRYPDWPAGMLRSSAADFTRFVAACANGGVAGDVRLLPTSVMVGMLTAHKPAGLPKWLTGQGLGWMQSTLNGRTVFEHWGGDTGAFTAAYLDPPLRRGAVIFTNTSATDEAKGAIKAIAARLIGAEPPP